MEGNEPDIWIMGIGFDVGQFIIIKTKSGNEPDIWIMGIGFDVGQFIIIKTKSGNEYAGCIIRLVADDSDRGNPPSVNLLIGKNEYMVRVFKSEIESVMWDNADHTEYYD